jgi:Flp pilus assembly protein TadB
MAQTKRKRKHKHRGTQAGTVEARGRTSRSSGGRPQSRSEARQMGRERRDARLDTPPTWRSAFNKAAISAVVFGVFAVLVLGLAVAAAALLTVVMVGVYLPLSYVTDRFFYNRRQRQKSPRGGR